MDKLPLKEKMAYGFGGLGQNMIYSLSSIYLMIFYTDVFEIKPLHVGIIFAVARIWDAMNDFIMGSIVDNTSTKIGKFRPFLLFASIPIGLLTILTFSAPDLDYALKIVYISVTYVLWGMVYTVSDVPYWGLSTALTKDPNERTKLISFTRLLTMIGMGIPYIVVPLLQELFEHESEQQAYLFIATIISFIGTILFSFAYFGTKERVIPKTEKRRLRTNLKLLNLNIPIKLILFSSLIGFSRNMAQSAGPYFAKYNLGDPTQFALLAGVFMAGIFISVILIPSLNHTISKRNLYISSSIMGGIFYFVAFFVGYKNIWILLIPLFFSAVSNGFFTVLQSAMIADSVDYLETKTHLRLEGLCFSGQTFFAKLSNALTSLTVSIVLTVTGYIEDMPQTEPVKMGIFLLVTIIPGIGTLISVIPMIFYRFKEIPN